MLIKRPRVHETISQKLNLFSEYGLKSTAIFQSKVDRFEDLAMTPEGFQKLLFLLFSGALNLPLQNNFKVKTNNCTDFFTLSLGYKRSSLLSYHDGVLSSPRQFLDSSFWESACHLIKESGGILTSSKVFSIFYEIHLQIPLIPQQKSHGLLIRRPFF